MSTMEIFCRQVRVRSKENAAAVHLLYKHSILSQIISILRQELDSMVRVIYLLNISDATYREELIEASVNGKKWLEQGTKKPITDRQMVELADKLNGWTKSVYKFGCAFIHLSNLHDYQARDPIKAISTEEREDIVQHLEYYHGFSFNPTKIDELRFDDIVPYLPRVFEKIASNLECYVKDLEDGKQKTDG